MPTARWNGAVIADAPQDDVIELESNIYFPPQAVRMEYLEQSGNHYRCPWKGLADYYNIFVDDLVNPDATWSYPDPSDAAAEIAGYFAFWKGVEIS